jgi:hypothetical protein
MPMHLQLNKDYPNKRLAWWCKALTAMPDLKLKLRAVGEQCKHVLLDCMVSMLGCCFT